MNSTQLISRLESIPAEEKTPELTELEQELRAHAKYFNELMTKIASTGVITEAIRREREVRGKLMREVGERILALLYDPFEDALPDTPLEQEQRLREHYITGLELLRKKEGLLRVEDPSDPERSKFMNIPGTVGILETLSDGREGYVAIDNKEYSAPTYEMIQQKFRERCDSDPVFRRKFDQQYGGGTMLLVPKGAKLQSFVESCESTLIMCIDEGKASGERTFPVSLRDDNNRVVYVENGYCKGGTTIVFWEESASNERGGTPDDTKLLYMPIYKDGGIDGGKTKEEYLKDSTFPGWDIVFLEQELTIPEKGIRKKLLTKNGRTRFKANETAVKYMKTLQEEEQYAGERGMTPEEYLLLVQTIAFTQREIFDYRHRNSGKANFLLGSRLVSWSVPSGEWNPNTKNLQLTSSGSDRRNEDRGFRPAVKM